MIRSRILLKSFAIFFIVEMLISSVAPAVSWALTAGPTAPEATSFEPVDTTDIVDLKTGDFVYNIPLLEVPGPGGSYPFSLSYHAGILPGQEASWTGLGFTLNPGSISRLVNGYPDDHNAVGNVDRSYWEGGETTTKLIGISYGIANVASVSVGLTFTNDTYKGRGVGGYIGGDYGIKLGVAKIGVSAQVSMSAYGDVSMSMGVGVGVSGASNGATFSGQVGVNFNSNSGVSSGASAGIGVGKTSLLGASVNSNSTSPSLSVGGGTAGIYNSQANHASIYSESFKIDIPIPYTYFSVSLGRDYQRYWIDETISAGTYGSVYLSTAKSSNETSFDTYDLLDLNLNAADFPDAEKVLGGSFPDVDSYTVTAQGVSGSIKPYNFQQELFRQDKNSENNDFITKCYPLSPLKVKPVQFRFINDFSNRLEYSPGNIQTHTDDNAASDNKVSFTFDFDDNITTGEFGTDGYNKGTNHLAGSKHIEWYSNLEILRADPNVNPFTEGFVDCKSEGFVRESNTQIGGYSVTNSSGVTYHYALPAYSYDEYMKSTNSSTKQIKDGVKFNELKKPTKYAYTWFLTAVTGPDYVDKNGNGLADHNDWGYWVNFEYKKWLDDYKWRNPGEGANRDLDGEFENFSAGKKEIYYLDKIITQSHVAIFEKSERKDAREVSDLYEGGFISKPIYAPNPDYVKCIEVCNNTNCTGQDCGTQIKTCTTACEQTYDEKIITGYTTTRGTLKLDKIKLFNYDDYLAEHTNESYLIREIDFGYDDYSLARGTSNSFDIENPSVKLGKLTLKTLTFLGKGGTKLIPPITFDYANNFPYEMDNGELKTDVWGYYKSDFTTVFRDATNDIIGKLTTAQSSQYVDAWSLNKIKTSTGAVIAIDYEGDEYTDVVLAKQEMLRTHYVTDYAPDKLKITFWEQVILSKYFTVEQEAEIDLVGTYNEKHTSQYDCTGDCDKRPGDRGYNPFSFSGKVTIEEVNDAGAYIIVNNHDYYDKVKNEPKIWFNGFDYNENNQHYRAFYKNHYENDQAWPDFIPVGVVSVPKKVGYYGGGVRVKSIALTNTSDPNSEGRITSYTYAKGTTTYEPFQILSPKTLPEYKDVAQPIGTEIHYKKLLLNKFYRQINISRQLPGPGVLYQYVTVREKTINNEGKAFDLPNYTRYEFEMYKEGMVDVVSPPSDFRTSEYGENTGTYEGIKFQNAYTNKVILKDFSSRVGNLKSVTLFNSDNDQPVSNTTNNYLSDGLDGSFASNISTYETNLSNQFKNQGVIEETFSRGRLVAHKVFEKKPYASDRGRDYFNEKQNSFLGTISKLESYPSIQIGQTNTNYKTGMKNESKNLAFDYYSGDATSILTNDSYGNRYLSVSVPAYKNYSSMGFRVIDKTNKNMLSQKTAQYSYIVKDDNTPTGVLSASITTWSNEIPVLNLETPQTNIWRMQANYVWNGQNALLNDGSYPYDNFKDHPFANWNNSSGQDLYWQKTNELTLYDVYSHGLEAKDINDNYACTRMNIHQDKVIASATNARYDETANSSAEYYIGSTQIDGGVSRGQGDPSPAHTHTGGYSLLVGSDKEGFNYTLKPGSADLSKKYRASVWVYLPGKAETQTDLDNLKLFYTSGGIEKSISPTIQKNKSKSWYLLNLDITPNGNGEIFIGVRNKTQRGAYFDDFRIHPLNASLTSYVYDASSGELNFILDANNFYTKFEYDGMGRLIRTTKELLNFDFGDSKESYRADLILKEMKYNYGKEKN